MLPLVLVAVCTEFYLCIEASPKLPPPLRATWLAASQLFGSWLLFSMLHPWLSSHHSLMLFSHSCPAPTDYLTACCYFYLIASLLSCLNQLLLCLSSPSVCKIEGWGLSTLAPITTLLEGFSVRLSLKSASSFSISNRQQAQNNINVIFCLSLPFWLWWTMTDSSAHSHAKRRQRREQTLISQDTS